MTEVDDVNVNMTTPEVFQINCVLYYFKSYPANVENMVRPQVTEADNVIVNMTTLDVFQITAVLCLFKSYPANVENMVSS